MGSKAPAIHKRLRPADEGEAAAARPGGLRRLTALLMRRPPPPDPALLLAAVRDELRDRLLAHRDAETPQLMRHLVFVHAELGRGGWPGVAALPARVLRRALTQAEMLASEEATPVMGQLVDRLRACHVAADIREERSERQDPARLGEHIEVSEASHEEFAEMQRGWVATVSPGLPRVHNAP